MSDREIPVTREEDEAFDGKAPEVDPVRESAGTPNAEPPACGACGVRPCAPGCKRQSFPTPPSADDRLGEEIEHLLNRHSRENESNTPDWVLSHLVMDVLLAFERATQRRDDWHGRPLPGSAVPVAAASDPTGATLPPAPPVAAPKDSVRANEETNPPVAPPTVPPGKPSGVAGAEVAAPPQAPPGFAGILYDLRSRGWMVAVHNDYRIGGTRMTFWLLTHEDGRWIKGEGSTDTEALTQCRRGLEPAEPLAPVAPAQKELPVDSPRVGPRGQPLDCHGRCLACGECPREPSETLPSCLCPGTTLGGSYGAPPVAPTKHDSWCEKAVRPCACAGRAARGFTPPTVPPNAAPTKTCEPWCGGERTPMGAKFWVNSAHDSLCLCTLACGTAGRPLNPAAPPVEAKPDEPKGEGANISITTTVRPTIFDSRLPSGMVLEATPALPDGYTLLGERARRLWAGRNAYNEIEMGRKVEALAAEATALEADRDEWKARDAASWQTSERWQANAVEIQNERDALRAQLAEANATIVNQGVRLVEADARVVEAIAGEREACAQLAETTDLRPYTDLLGDVVYPVAIAIRARSGEPSSAVTP